MTNLLEKTANDSQATARLAQTVMRRQLVLSLRVAAVFLLLLLGLPLLNWLAPGVMGARIGGFTVTWLFLGALFYPLTWALSGYFIRHSDRIEAQLTQELQQPEKTR